MNRNETINILPSQTSEVEVKTEQKKGATIYTVSYKEGQLFDRTNYPNTVLFHREIKNGETKEVWIELPVLNEQLNFKYTDNEFTAIAEGKMEFVKDAYMPNYSILEKNGEIISESYNGALLHQQNINKGLYVDFQGCLRKMSNSETGKQYDLCAACDPANHGEISAVKKALQEGKAELLVGSTEYMFGHWWCCEGCQKAMADAGVTHVVISKKWTQQFLDISI